MTQSVFAGTNSGQGSTHRAVRSERRGWSFGRFWALALLLGAALLCSGQSATAATPLGNCSSESGLTGRGDIVFCEGWESADWWRNGYLKTASTSAPGAAVSADVANTQVVTSGCVSGSCLRVEMKQYQSGALAVHWPLKAAGLQPEELHLRYYLKLGENFDPAAEVFLDGVKLQSEWVDAGHLRVLVPAATPQGRAQVRVANPSGGDSIRPLWVGSFIYLPAITR